jgi:hypothetical protein
MEVGNMNANIKKLVAAGYVVSPSNIYNLPGVRMYAKGPGTKEPITNMELWVTEDKIRIVARATNCHTGEFVGMLAIFTFATVKSYLEWIDKHGVVSEPGLSSFSNSWD